MEYIISFIVLPILFLAHIVMSGILIKEQLKEIKHLRSELEELYTNGLAQLKANINLKKYSN